jgi:histidinol-phosphate phosphatase family protein
MTQLVILAGGKGTRLRERLGGKPKPLIDVCGVPLLERQILIAQRYGFTRVLLLVNHAADQVIEFCAARRNWQMDLEILDDGDPRGTAGATLAAFDRLASEFLVMYGDTMMDVDLRRFHAFHSQSTGAAATLFLHPNDHPHDSDLVETDDDGRVVAFHSCPHDSSRWYPNLVNAALYWIRRDALAAWRRLPGAPDFGKDLFPAMLEKGIEIRGYRSPEYIKDLGTPPRLDRVCADLRSGKIARASLETRQPMIFIDRDGTINREVDHLCDPAQLELLPGVPEAIKRLNESEYRCCVVSNQPVVARGECTEEGMREIHAKLETLLGRRHSYLDRIYYCPHHPDRGFAGERPELKIDCDCRKPKIGLIERAARDFNVAIERSWLIGDTSTDMETARRAGLKSLLVETGYAGLDYKSWALPDVVVPDLNSAVSFVLDQYPRLFAYCNMLADAMHPGALVLIGGQARSGKSTFAAVLRDALRSRGTGALVLSLDRWLKSEADRGPGVLSRYDMTAIERVLASVQARRTRAMNLDLPGYHKLKYQRVESVEAVRILPSDVVIVEGTVALALEPDASTETHRFHVDIEESTRRQRILNEYRLRGLDESAALDVYVRRTEDELPTVERLASASHRISLADVSGSTARFFA